MMSTWLLSGVADRVAMSAGIFVAMLAIGCGWGRLVGMAVQGLAAGVEGAPPISLPAYTIVGAAAMLGEEWACKCLHLLACPSIIIPGIDCSISMKAHEYVCPMQAA